MGWSVHRLDARGQLSELGDRVAAVIQAAEPRLRDFGAGRRPRWLAYSLGFASVGAYLADQPIARPSTLATELAASFRPYLDQMNIPQRVDF